MFHGKTEFVPQNNRTVAPQTRTGLHGLRIVIQTENPIVTQIRAGLVQNVVQAAKTVDEQIRPVRNTLNRLFKEEISTSEQRFWYTEL